MWSSRFLVIWPRWSCRTRRSSTISCFAPVRKQEIVDDLLVLQDQRGQMTRKREDHMDVTRWEKLLATCCEPTIASSCLTLRAVPISARVVGDGAMSAAGAFIEMSAERGGTTPRNRQE